MKTSKAEQVYLDKHRDQYSCGNELYEYISGGREYILWRRRRDRIHAFFYIGVALITFPMVAFLTLYYLTEPSGMLWAHIISGVPVETQSN